MSDDKLAGLFEFHSKSKEDFVEIEFGLFKDHRKKGIMSKILLNMISFAKDKFKKNKMMAITNVGTQHFLI